MCFFITEAERFLKNFNFTIKITKVTNSYYDIKTLQVLYC